MDCVLTWRSPPPWKHQEDIRNHTWRRPYFALFMEPRTGKTRIIIESAYLLAQEDGLRTVIILAPNGVHRNWITDEFPQWAPKPYHGLIWRSSKAPTHKFQVECTQALDVPELLVAAFNIDAVTNAKAQLLIKKLCSRGPAMMVVDESSDIAHGTSARTKAACKLATLATWRRILDGTPTSESPLDLYSQCNFLQWGALGYTSFIAFRYRYAVLKKMEFGGVQQTCPSCQGKSKGLQPCPTCAERGCNDCGYSGYASTKGVCSRCLGKGELTIGGKEFDQVVGYKNLDELKGRIARFSVSVLRSDCRDMPPKLFTRRRFAMSSEQARVYTELKKGYTAELRDGRRITAAAALVRYLRLQQVAHNFYPETTEAIQCPACEGNGCEHCDGTGLVLIKKPLLRIDQNHNRLEALLAELRQQAGQRIIWTRFHEDADLIMAEIGKDAVRYDGTVNEGQRAINKAAFQSGAVRDIVASPAAGGRGLDFSMAESMFFYGHTFRLRLRQQAEDRGEKLTRTTSMSVCDIVAEDSVDEYILDKLAGKQDLAALIMSGGGLDGLTA